MNLSFLIKKTELSLAAAFFTFLILKNPYIESKQFLISYSDLIIVILNLIVSSLSLIRFNLATHSFK